MKQKHETRSRTAAPMGAALLTASLLGLLASAPTASAHDEPCGVQFGSTGPTVNTSGCQHNVFHGVGGVWNTTADNVNAQCEWAFSNPAVGRECPVTVAHFPPRYIQKNELS